jgi:hypothetical protein
MPDKDESKSYDASGNVTSSGVAPTEEAKKSRASTLAAARYDPNLQTKPMSQADVQAAGGLGAIAERLRKKKQAATQATQAEALEKQGP